MNSFETSVDGIYALGDVKRRARIPSSRKL